MTLFFTEQCTYESDLFGYFTFTFNLLFYTKISKESVKLGLFLHNSHVACSTCVCPGGPRLKFSELLRHVMEVLQSSYSCSAYGEEYSSLLVKDILSVRKYWCDVTTQQWQSQWAIFTLC